MKIRMKVDISGSRDGMPWPRRGGVVDLGDDEAAQLCRAGMAEPVAEPAARVETATPPKEEQRVLTTETAASTVPAPEERPAAPELAAPAAEAAPRRGRPPKKAADSKPAGE